jgi:methyl-accepting chemotaxis protein
LSINTAIEASAGPQGAAFKVIASKSATWRPIRIRRRRGSVPRSRKCKTLQDEVGGNTAQSASDLDRIAATAEAVGRLRSSFEHVRDTGDQQYAQMMAHGEELVATTANMLGHLQFRTWSGNAWTASGCRRTPQCALAQMAGETSIILPGP